MYTRKYSRNTHDALQQFLANQRSEWCFSIAVQEFPAFLSLQYTLSLRLFNPIVLKEKQYLDY